MTEKKLAEELLAEDAGGEGGGDVQQILERAKSRLRILGALTVFVWAVAAAAFVACVYLFLLFVWPKLADGGPWPPGSARAVAHFLLAAAIVWAGLFALAAGCTILFVVRSRQATLRQIQVSLQEISERLQRTRQ